MRRLFLMAILAAIVTVIVGCAASNDSATTRQSVDWQMLKSGWGAWTTSSGPTVGTHLFQTDADLLAWTTQYGFPENLTIPTENVDFSRDTVAVIVRGVAHSEPVVTSVVVDDGKDRVKLTSRPVGPPSIPSGSEIRRFVALRVPKVNSLSVDEDTHADMTAATVSSPTPNMDRSQAVLKRGCLTQHPPAKEGFTVLSVYYTCQDDALPATPRAVPRQVAVHLATPLTASEELLKGPTQDERSNGYWSWFDTKTAGMLNSVTITADGRAVVDFKDFSAVIPNASTAAGAGQLLREIGLTLAQFDQINEIEFLFDGDCEAFWGWLQTDCQVVPVSRYR